MISPLMFDPLRLPTWIIDQLSEPMQTRLRGAYRRTRAVARSVRAVRGWIRAERIVWLRPEMADLESFRLFKPERGQILLRTHASVVSPGTERALLQGLPNDRISFPSVPGYSASGVVLAVGRGVTPLPGTRVAGIAPHASHSLVNAARLVPIPNGMSDTDACFTQLGVISLQAVRRARIRPGECVVVLGLGLIGQLALQLAAWAGAAPLIAIARSPTWLAVARACGADRVIDLASYPDAPAEMQADVVLEATGSAQAILIALQCARPGGRVVLLGSSRGITSGVDFNRMVTSRSIQLIGAHISSLREHEAPNGWTWRDEAELFLDLVNCRRVRLSPLITRQVAPTEAKTVYDELVGGRSPALGIIFDWKLVGKSKQSNLTNTKLLSTSAGCRRVAL